MSAHVLRVGKRDKCKSDKISAFRSEFNKFNDTGEGMLDSVNYVTLKLIKHRIDDAKTSRYCHLLHNGIMNVIA